MTSLNIAHQRLYNQHINHALLAKPGDVVAWLGAVQAQDYLGALWAVGLRTSKAVEADIERALADKSIVRTWPLRGTLHFVAAADVRWMLDLLTPRIIKSSAVRFQQFGLDDRVFARSRAVFERALAGGRQLPREAMYQRLEAARISAAGGRGLQILFRLAGEGLLCFGARQGKQQTFTLLDEWVPTAKPLARDEALAELARRYFTSHGPATLQDFLWWSGLRAADARAALELAKPQLGHAVIGDQTYWLASSIADPTVASPKAYLLPPFDEYTVAYKDRSAVLDPMYVRRLHTGNGIFSPIIVLDGQVVGTWKRALKKDTLAIALSPFEKLNKAATRAVETAANRYGEFLGASVVWP
jgi:hypothetical protein